MSGDSRLPVVLCWHMHQPFYLDRETNQYQLPWTYLHAIKDYVDMAAVIEETPGAKAVVNFAPTLLEQIEDYAQQLRGYLTTGSPIRDPLLAALIMPALPTDPQQRLMLVRASLRANRRRLIDRFPAFRRLADLAACITTEPESAVSSAAQQCISVDLPEPLGPITAVKRPASRSTETPSRATTWAAPVP